MASKKRSKSKKSKRPTKAEISAAARILSANSPKKNPKAGRAAKKVSSKSRAVPRRKLSMAARKRIGAASRARWKARKHAGRPGKGGKGHIPLRVLEKNHENLGRLISIRKKSPAAWA